MVSKNKYNQIKFLSSCKLKPDIKLIVKNFELDSTSKIHPVVTC